MKNTYKTKAVVRKYSDTVDLEINNFTYLTTPVRSLLNKALKLKKGDLVEITVKVVKRKK